MSHLVITQFTKVVSSSTWDNAPMKPTCTTVSASDADIKASVDAVLDNLSQMQSGEVVNFIVTKV